MNKAIEFYLFWTILLTVQRIRQTYPKIREEMKGWFKKWKS